MSRKLLAAGLMLAMSGFSGAFAQELSLTGISPAPGSEINTFDFTLNFDLSAVRAAHGEGDYGIGWLRGGNVTLYKGEPEQGIKIGYSILSGTMHGLYRDFVISNSVSFSFEDRAPQPGQKYTLCIQKTFYAYMKGDKAEMSDPLDYSTDPLIYTFTGGTDPVSEVILESCFPRSVSNMEELSTATFNFNRPVVYDSSKPIILTQYDATVATPREVNISDDGLTATVVFDKVMLYKGSSYPKDYYVLSVPEGAFISKADRSYSFAGIQLQIKGTAFRLFGEVASTNPPSGSTGFFDTIQVNFDMIPGYMIANADGQKPFNMYGGQSYFRIFEVGEDGTPGKDEVGRTSSSNPTATHDGIISKTYSESVALKPGTTYLYNIPKSSFRPVAAGNDTYDLNLGNPEINLTITTPTLEEVGAPPVRFDAPVYMNGDEILEGNKFAYLSTIVLPLKGNRPYEYKYEEYEPSLSYCGNTFFYDITDDNNPKLIAELKPASSSKTAFKVDFNRPLYNNRKYRLYIPEGALKFKTDRYQNYFISPEMTLDFYGATPAGKFSAAKCNIENNADRSNLNIVIWTFENRYSHTDVPALFGREGDMKPVSTVISTVSNNTVVTVFCLDQETGLPYSLLPGEQYKVVFPEGVLYSPIEPAVKNTETTLTVNGVSEFETVALTLTQDAVTSTMQTMKGENVSLNLLPGQGWSVSKLSLNGSDVTASVKNGSYTTPALDADSSLAVTLAYTGDWAEEQSNGEWTISGTDITIHGEDGMIVVSGAPEGSAVNVYTEGGSEIGTATSEGKPLLISASTGNTYIVVTAAHAAKITL